MQILKDHAMNVAGK